ncbi:MAG: hypothetical protein HKN85_09840, partial [Gammaproteobacteria bacterium]|nr:hypothetical protein [Gammaproteobacteria bacterium]
MIRNSLCTLLLTFAIGIGPASAADRYEGRSLPASIEAMKLDAPLAIGATHPRMDRSLATAQGPQQVIVRLKGEPVARGGDKADILAEQEQFLQRCLSLPSARSIASVQMVLNAVFLEVDAA